jgi:hypothetical protein
MKALFRLSAVLFALLFVFPLCGYSYIDLGSGSYIIQLIIAGFVGFSLSLRIFWKKIRSRFSKKAKTDETGHAQ